MDNFNKFKRSSQGPFTALERCSKVIFKIQLPDELNSTIQKIHINRLLPITKRKKHLHQPVNDPNINDKNADDKSMAESSSSGQIIGEKSSNRALQNEQEIVPAIDDAVPVDTSQNDPEVNPEESQQQKT